MQHGSIHHIQKNILLRLIASSPLRFSELQPADLPNNTFSYHLKRLVELGYVEHTADAGYSPTRKALKALHYGDPRHAKPSRPLLLTMLYITNSEGKVLLIERNNDPFKGWYGIPSGYMHTGESLAEAASRELYEKTTIPLEASALALKGVVDFRYVDPESKDTFVHAVGFVFTGTYDKESIEGLISEHGTLHWSALTNLRVLPEVYEAKKLIESTDVSIVSGVFDEPKTPPIKS